MTAFAAGPAVQLRWSTQPGSATVGAPFGQQPVLITADATGAPSTIGLAGSVVVTIDTEPAGHLSGGPIVVDLGTSGLNGVATLSGLQINDAGGYSIVAKAGNGTNGVFSPVAGLPAAKLWLDASDAATLTISPNNHLYNWQDKSGINNNATNINAGNVEANAPFTNLNVNLAATAYGGQRTVSFYGTNRLNVNLTGITNSTYSIIALTLLDPAVTANNDYYIGSPFIGDGLSKVLHVGYRNVGSYTLAHYDDDLNVPAPPAGPVIGSLIHPPGQQQIFLNGALAGSRNVTRPHLITIGQANIGQGSGGNFHGDIAEVIVYSTNLTELQRVGVENYLYNKWLGQLSSAAVSVPFFVGSGQTVAGLRFSQQPSDTVAGNNISPNVTVLVTNSSGAGLSGIPVALSLASGSGTLNGTVTQPTDVNGVATFADLNMIVAGTKSLQALISGAATNTSTAFNIIPAAASQLVINTQPSANATAGIAFPAQPVVSIRDAFGNVASSTDVIVASQTAGGTLSQTVANSVSVAAVNGVATFTGLNITNAGTSTLTFTSGVFPVINSGNINVAPGAPTLMTVQQQPSATAQVGVVFDTQPIIFVTDAFGNTVANNTIVTASASAGTIQGPTPTAGTVAGVATFAGLYVTNTGNITLTFAAGAASINSSVINVSAGPATMVAWTTQPGSVVSGSPFGQQPVLKTVDAAGSVTTQGLTPTNLVVVRLVSGTGLVGSRRTFNIGTDGYNGVINFTDLQIDASVSGSGYVLAADYIGAEITPTNIPNSILWLDSYDHSTLSMQNDNVVTWVDKSGLGNNATNNTNFPKTKVNTPISQFAYGGQETVDFFGTNRLNVDLTPLSGFEGYTIFVVDVVREIPSATYFMGSAFNDAAPNDNALHFGYRDADSFTLAQYADDLNYDAPVAFAFATPRLWTLRLGADAVQAIYLNGVQRATRGANGAPSALLQGFVGQGSGGDYRGQLAEVVVYERGLDDIERAQVEKYLTHKWLSSSRALTTPFAVTSITPTLSISKNGVGATLTVTGQSGRTYRLLAAGSPALPLASWTPIGTNTLGGTGVWQFNDSSVQTTRYYRAVTP